MSILSSNYQPKALGHKVTSSELDPIPLKGTQYLREVEFTSDEVTAVCPVTDQPDQYTVKINFEPGDFSLESKSLKLYLQGYRNTGIFCEQLAEIICQDICKAVDPRTCDVSVTQKSRGGIILVATATKLPYR